MYTKNVPKEIKDMLRGIAIDTGNDYQLVEDIYFHEFEFLRDQMASGERGLPKTYKNVLLKYFGSFLSNERHILKLKEITDKKNEEIDTNCDR